MSDPIPSSIFHNRLGFHYYSDTLHFTERDSSVWLPTFQTVGASWLVLKSSITHAIPEPFLRSCLQSNITPFVNFDLSINNLPPTSELQVLFEAYSRWGVKFVSLFDQPNASSNWPSGSWAQQDLVNRFMDRYIPLANLALQAGLTPVFPALQPGGSYWDTVFLRSSLAVLEHRQERNLLDKLVLSCYSVTAGHPLDWGIGGPERWPEAHPYLTSASEPDQRGFRIFDWYLAISQAILQKSPPIILLAAGSCSMPGSMPLCDQTEDQPEHALEIARIFTNPPADAQACTPEQLPGSVIAACIWPLTSEEKGAQAGHNWFETDGTLAAQAAAVVAWAKNLDKSPAAAKSAAGEHPIQHYLLLPSYEWGIADWHLEVIQPFVKRHRATVGFSLEEARLARKVTVLGGPQVFSEDALTQLRQSGSLVDRISGDGTTIASLLAER